MIKKVFALLGLSVLCIDAMAGPADYVFTPTVDYGEKEIDLKAGSADAHDGRDNAATLGFGYGVTPFWFTEAYGVWEDNPHAGARLQAFEWENKFQLTETGKHWFEVGVIAELEIPRDGDDPKEFLFGPLFQTSIDRWQLNANVLFERKFDGDKEPGEERHTELLYQWQAKYRL